MRKKYGFFNKEVFCTNNYNQYIDAKDCLDKHQIIYRTQLFNPGILGRGASYLKDSNCTTVYYLYVDKFHENAAKYFIYREQRRKQ